MIFNIPRYTNSARTFEARARPYTLVGCEFDRLIYRIIGRFDGPKLSREIHYPEGKTWLCVRLIPNKRVRTILPRSSIHMVSQLYRGISVALPCPYGEELSLATSQMHPTE